MFHAKILGHQGHMTCIQEYMPLKPHVIHQQYLLLKLPCHSLARVRAVRSNMIWAQAVCIKQNDVSPLKCVILPLPYSAIFISIQVLVFFLSRAVKFILLAKAYSLLETKIYKTRLMMSQKGFLQRSVKNKTTLQKTEQRSC